MLLWKREKKKERERKQKSDAFLFRWWGWWGWKNDWAPNLPQWASYTGHYSNRHHHTSLNIQICKWGGSLITITIISLRLTLFSRQTRNIFPFVKTGKLEWHWFLVNFSISGWLRWWEERAILSLSFAAIFPRFWNSEILLSPKSDVIFFFIIWNWFVFKYPDEPPPRLRNEQFAAFFFFGWVGGFRPCLVFSESICM